MNQGFEEETTLIIFLRKCILKFILTTYDAETVMAFNLLSQYRSEELIEKYLDAKKCPSTSLYLLSIYTQ